MIISGTLPVFWSGTADLLSLISTIVISAVSSNVQYSQYLHYSERPAQPSPPRVSLQVFVLIENKTKSRVTNDSHYISFVSVCQVDCGLASAWCGDWTPVLLLSLSPPDLSLVLVLMEREIKIKLKIKQISIFPKFRYFFTLNEMRWYLKSNLKWLWPEQVWGLC